MISAHAERVSGESSRIGKQGHQQKIPAPRRAENWSPRGVPL